VWRGDKAERRKPPMTESVVEAWSWVSTQGEAEGLSETGQVGQWVAQG
jgi:hypothetical protein